MIQAYRKHTNERQEKGLPPLPLTPLQTQQLCKLLETPPPGEENYLQDLLVHHISPGVDPAAEIKAEWLNHIATGETISPVVSPADAVVYLGTMLGGYNIEPLIALLSNDGLGDLAATALKHTILIYNAYDRIVALSKTNSRARNVLQSWADADWFTSRDIFPDEFKVKIYKVDGEINTDDFSPAKDAWSRSDIPLHSLCMGESRFPEGLETIRKFREEGFRVAFVGDVVGTGSSRKSACNSVMWHIGEDTPFVPNKRRAGIVLGNLIAPIFFNTTEDSGGLPILCDVQQLKTGDEVTINTKEGKIFSSSGKVLSIFEIKPATLRDEFRAGGRLNLIIGRSLTQKARKTLNLPESTVFIAPDNPTPKPDQGYSLAQKIVGKACGLPGVLPGTACEPEMATVGSQDTTGLMTADELKELACLEFQAGMFMQSFCHTAAYPKPSDVQMHETLPDFVTLRKGVSLHPGDGVVHTWLNRLILPDTVGTGGDSHTRFPLGISFPAGSGLVAFAGALGFMPLDMPESVLVKFKGKFNPGITLRDAVNSIPYFAIQKGLLTVEKQNKKNIFNGRILEIEGLTDLTVEQAFELTDASAERSAAAATVKLPEKTVAEYLRSNIALMQKMIENGFKNADTLKHRIEACEEWLVQPALLTRDENAEYAAVLEIDLSDITEPILACPNDPDDVKLLSDVSNRKIDEVFIGSCMTNIGHFRAAGYIWKGEKQAPSKIWLTPPTKMDRATLMKEGYYSIFNAVGARTEVPGCSLCMGNQARVKTNATVISTSTRNFDNRMGDGAQVFLGSAELAAVTGLLGRLPEPAEYFNYIKERVNPNHADIYRYLKFHKMENLHLDYVE